MDRLLKLKLAMVYRDLPVDMARQIFDELKEQKKVPDHTKPAAPAKPKLRIRTKGK